jgi:hypothetical protein
MLVFGTLMGLALSVPASPASLGALAPSVSQVNATPTRKPLPQYFPGAI